MKKYFFLLVGFLVVQSLLVSGCSNIAEKPTEIKKITDKAGPSSVEYSFDGFYGEVDGNMLAVCKIAGIEIYDLEKGKLIKEIPVSKEYGILGLDISGELITWAEKAPEGIAKGGAGDTQREDYNIFVYNYITDEKKQITNDTNVQSYPRLWKNYLVWRDNRADKTKGYPGKWSLYLYDLNTGIEKEITSTLAAHASYNINDDKIVWEDDRNNKASDIIRGGENLPENNKDIFLYDIKTGKERAIATGPYMESKPDISGEYIVWEDRNNNTLNADILLYDLKSSDKFYLTKDEVDQGTPRLYGEYVVWMDERRGISTNDVIINGNLPNSDVMLYNIKTKTERILTGDGPQILPSISAGWVSYVLSRQVEPKVEAVRY